MIGIKEMKLVEIRSEDPEFYYCYEIGSYPRNMVVINKRCLKMYPDDYRMQRDKKTILVRAV